jgi:2-dehydro-3-deoxyphosphogluconate aldolase/(4S)-4-hydroxy-2-oxoglutarate aldolase
MSTTAPFDRARFDALPVVGILRGFAAEVVEPMLGAAIDGGLRNVEVTMNTPNAESQIRLICDRWGKEVQVGAGTVTTLDLLERALEAGARFIVTPSLNPEVVRACVARGVPVMPGAMSPTEIVAAWELGATLVKIFPADGLGPAFIRSLRGPLPHIPLMPTGGVTAETLPAFRAAGAAAFGVGTPLFDPARAAARDWTWFRQQAERFAQAWAWAGPRGR